MVELLNGPVPWGTKLHLRFAPVYLRVVVDGNGKVDALDLPEDKPTATEKVYAYKAIEGTYSTSFLCGVKNGRGKRGCTHIVSAKYKIINEQPDKKTISDTQAWARWVTKHNAKEKV